MIDTGLRAWLGLRLPRIKRIQQSPMLPQEEWFHALIKKAIPTDWGKHYHYAELKDIAQFQSRVPVQDYEAFFPWIESILKGNKNVVWPGTVNWFAKSSGTTNDRSKFLPITPEALADNHFRAGRDMLAIYYHHHPESKLSRGKNLVIGGSHEVNRLNVHSQAGDLSAVLIENMPALYAYFQTPGKAITLLGNWEQKLEAITRITRNQRITGMTGVPTWLLVLIDRIFKEQGITSGNLLEVWPDLEVFFHGAVRFDPYRERFKKLIPSDRMSYLETYNASEGFFALQDEPHSSDLLLLTDHGIFYEFIPLTQLTEAFPKALTVGEVMVGETYGLVITTNAGLWRYQVGDTVTIASTQPLRIRVAGRTQHFINAFGEELMIGNAETAITHACLQTGANVSDFTAGPIYSTSEIKGTHEWIIEFETPPPALEVFTQILDAELRKLNSDYDAKRYHDLAMRLPVIHGVPKGTFYQWMKSRNRLGGQHKVPRLSNHRQYLEDILATV